MFDAGLDDLEELLLWARHDASPRSKAWRGAAPRRPTTRSNIQRDTQTEVNRLVMMPTNSVTAKPRMGPEP